MIEMKESRMKSSLMKAAAPFVAMVIVECSDAGLTTFSKAAMLHGMSNFVFVVYYNALGTLILFPFYLYNILSGRSVPLTFSLLYKFFLLGLIGISLLQICAYTGINYSSPTLAATISNLIPGFTFILAVLLRMEKLDLTKSSSLAKCLGTIVAIAGATVATLYTGPAILMVADSPSNLSNKHFSPSSLWALGGLLLVITSLLAAILNILQTHTAKECPDKVVLVFFFSLFGTMLAALFSVFLEKDPNAWRLNHEIEIAVIIYAAVSTTVIRNIIFTWCLRERGPVYVATYKPLAIVISMIMGLIFLGDNVYLGSVIGSIAIAAGFYTVLWGKATEPDIAKDVHDLESTCEQNAPLLTNAPLLKSYK